ncbi:MAG: SRPBCC domain-containing protein [Anaerolineae bacterium]|nr:MAG: SRPBCC domain-containing protein [Anaerolineae bacterium]
MIIRPSNIKQKKSGSPETIWGILTDASKYSEWDPGMIRLEGKIAPGEQITIYTKVSPDRAFKPTVTDYEPNRKMVWRSGMPMGLFQGARTFLLEPLADNSVKFTLREEFSGLMMPLKERAEQKT